jgi:hypothetical protein
MSTIETSSQRTSSSSAAAAAPSPGDGLQRVPPQSIEAEACVLGSMILQSPTIDIIVQVLDAEHFYRPAHQVIFQALVGMKDRRSEIDLVTLKDELQRRNQLDQVGGVDYLVQLVDGTPSAANAEYYAKIVRDKAMLRQLIVTLSRLRPCWSRRSNSFRNTTGNSSPALPRAITSSTSLRRVSRMAR